MRHVIKKGIWIFAMAVVVGGCAAAPLKTDASTSGIRAAEEVGAGNVPQASLHLQLAKEELKQAEKMAANSESEMAESMLLRAEADAELAVLLSREDSEKKEAQDAVTRVRRFEANNQ
jgi:pyridoxal biosynthesis lyase PdxS